MTDHQDLIRRAVKWLRRTKGCSCVISEQSSAAAETPDAIGWKYGRSHLVEVKISRADFCADMKKRWRRRPEIGMGAYRYYMVPDGLVIPSELPDRWGLLCVQENRVVIARVPAAHTEYNRDSEIAFMSSSLRRVQIRLGATELGEWLNRAAMSETRLADDSEKSPQNFPATPTPTFQTDGLYE
jgi:hypothetical protein